MRNAAESGETINRTLCAAAMWKETNSKEAHDMLYVFAPVLPSGIS